MFWLEAHNSYLENIQSYLEDPEISIQDCESATQLSQRHLLELFEICKSIDFRSPEEEILFFKVIQSKVYSHLEFFKQAGSYRLERSTQNLSSQKKYMRKSLASTNKFLNSHKDFYHYILLEKNHLDSIYFIRANCPKTGFIFPFIVDPKCTTPHSILLGKLKGYRLFSNYLINQSENNPGALLPAKTQSLKWTGKKIDLTELVYALHAAGVFNHGNASIKTIADSLQKQFGCPIGNVYRSYTDLRYRKKIRAKFLVQLCEKLSEKMESDES